MTRKDIAGMLDGAEYPPRVSRETERLAKEAGIVIVYGVSDDLMEFRGAIHDELGAYGGLVCRVDHKGLVPDWEVVLEDGDKDLIRDYFARENGGQTIEALWCAEQGYSWTYKTDIPHETFEIVEDGEPYCRGIVFRLSDAAPQPSAAADGIA